MEDSRKVGEAEKKDVHHLIHTWMEEMVKKAIVYNTKKEEKERWTERKQTRKEKERKRENINFEEIQQQKGRI